MTARMVFDVESETAFHRRCDELVTEFTTWLGPSLAETLDPSDLQLLLDWKWGYGGGHLDTWSRADLDEFLLGWCPRKLMAAPNEAATIPVVVSIAMSFLAESGLLDTASEPVDVLRGHAAERQAVFEEAMADPANFGMAKSLFSGMDITEPSSLNAEDLEHVIADFNSEPIDVRKALTDPALSARVGTPYQETSPVIGPIRVSRPEDVLASAWAAPARETMVKISDYFAAPGRLLTAKGNIKMADARELVEILGTGDVERTVIGDHSWSKQSSTEFAQLDHWQWWAREAGVLRTKHNRLVAIAVWRKRLADDPVSTLHKLVDVILDYGVLASYRRRHMPIEQLVDACAAPLLAMVAETRGPLAYDELVETAGRIVESEGVQEYYPGEVEHSVDGLLTMFERAGLVTQSGQTHTEKHHVPWRTGGTVAITPFGAAFIVEKARGYGVEVLVDQDPQDMTLDDLVASLESRVDPLDLAWDDIAAWLGAQPSRDSALVGVLAGMTALNLGLLLGVVPPDFSKDLGPALHELVGTAEPAASAMAASWLLEHDESFASQMDPAQVVETALLMLETISQAGDDDMVMEMLTDMQEATGISDRTQLLQLFADRGREGGLRVLEAVGRSHEDKRLSKLARKEAFRLGSKLANAGLA